MNLSNLSKILKTEPKFRFKQAYKAIFVDFISSWFDLSVFPLPLRERLKQDCPLEISGEIYKAKDKKSEKAVIDLADENKIETVLIRQAAGRNTVCLSSQVGCPLACQFCASGSLGFKRNLDQNEIIMQFLFWARYLKKEQKKIDNLVFMGIGEPLLNYDNLIKAINTLNDPEKINFGARRISVSTVGLPKEIRKLAKEPWQINLAISLHAPNDNIRSKIMPKAVKLASLSDIFKSADYYLAKTNRRLMFEYVLIEDINDQENLIKELIPLMKKPLYFLNLIPYNQASNFKATSDKKIQEIADNLKSAGIRVTIRHSHGDDIMAACGQLITKKNKK